MPKRKGLERGGTLGQEGELGEGSPGRDLERGGHGEKLDRDQERQRGGIGREPNLEEKHKKQPTHAVD
jgi:hypothetical protein